MKKQTRWIILACTILMGLSFILTGCGDDGDNIVIVTNCPAAYRITMTNMTNNQPMSPPVFIFHTPAYSAWALGSSVTSGLEQLAESGDGALLLVEANAATGVSATAQGAGSVVPGGQSAVTQIVVANADLQVSIATMLVNTNDAFTGTTGWNIGSMSVGDIFHGALLPYDAGTEDNIETALTIPGPAGGGEGFNAARSANNFVTIHPGVVTADDGLATSALDESHRFQSPVAEIMIERLN